MKQLAHALEKAGLTEGAVADRIRMRDPPLPPQLPRETRNPYRLSSHQREHSHQIKGPYGFLTGQYALDVATLARIGVRSLSYRQGESPMLAPWALRYSPDDAYIDLDRLNWWDKWAVVWSRIGAHYFQEHNGR